MGDWRFDGGAGRPSLWAVGFFLVSLTVAGAGAILLARLPIG